MAGVSHVFRGLTVRPSDPSRLQLCGPVTSSAVPVSVCRLGCTVNGLQVDKTLTVLWDIGEYHINLDTAQAGGQSPMSSDEEDS